MAETRDLKNAELLPITPSVSSHQQYILPKKENKMSGFGTESSPIELMSEDEQPIQKKGSKKRPDPTIGKNPNLLNHLPLEIFNMIVTSPLLSNVDRRCLKMTSKALQTSTIKTTAPSKAEFRQFNKRFEASIPRFSTNPLATKLLCHHCSRYLPRSKFPDAHAQAACKSRDRTCLRCSIKEGSLHKRCFLLDKKKHFVCQACKECKLVDGEMAPVANGTEFTIWQKFSETRNVELKVNVSGRRWCKACWKALDGFWKYAGEKGRMRENYNGGGGMP